MEKESRIWLGGAFGALSSVFLAAALVGVRDSLHMVNVALALVLCVLLGAMIGGRGAGVLSAVVAALSFDFFHTLPYNSLKIANADDIMTTTMLLVVGVVVGGVAGRADVQRNASRSRRRDLARVHRVAQLAAEGEHFEDLVSALRSELIETLDLKECSFEVAPFAQALPTLSPTGVDDETLHRYTRAGFELPREAVALPVVAGGRTVGRFVLTPTPGAGVSAESRLVAITLADQLGVVLSGTASPGRP